jgi:hypothetical protein
MFGETRLATPYFQQMILRSKIPKIYNSRFASKMKWSVNYFGVECQLFWSEVSIILIILRALFFLKIGSAKCNFIINFGMLV